MGIFTNRVENHHDNVFNINKNLKLNYANFLRLLTTFRQETISPFNLPFNIKGTLLPILVLKNFFPEGEMKFSVFG